jgi:hypothetical protein
MPEGSDPKSDPRLRGLLQIGAIVALFIVIIVALNIPPLWLGNLR